MPLHCNNFVMSVERVVVKLKIIKQFTWYSEYLKLSCIFTIIQLNCSIVHDIEHFISEGNNFMVHKYIYIYIYI